MANKTALESKTLPVNTLNNLPAVWLKPLPRLTNPLPLGLPVDHFHTTPSSPNGRLSVIGRTNEGPVSTDPRRAGKTVLPVTESHENNKEQEASEDAEGTRTGRWTGAEHRLLLEALSKYGNQWKKVCDYVGTRSPCQARSHAQKYFAKVKAKTIRRLRNVEPQSRKVFAITREYLNRTVAPAKLLEVPDNAYRTSKKLNNSKRDRPEATEVFQFAAPVQTQLASLAAFPATVSHMPTLAMCQVPAGAVSQGQGLRQPTIFLAGQQCFGMSAYYIVPQGTTLGPYAGSIGVRPCISYS